MPLPYALAAKIRTDFVFIDDAVENSHSRPAELLPVAVPTRLTLVSLVDHQKYWSGRDCFPYRKLVVNNTLTSNRG
jgi:hypothetical protein